ncbi:uncharacterized protein EV420DRAFT_703057 [Desarmillaria tabescens]|uniref:Uncharacterized protein n=1 Tax=Armillaria tabescens TaxID=1929756 RepID=A0AA39JZZ4_ARMTA|nr:uncharacterized protein EV420DRAFT_703057 [Desarmillaria tabescens]KAK0452020.1 hypothetical protein EV420DRAFT_703057 [Desarmillaria tabescens]
MCSSLNGPSCRSYVQARHTGRVRAPAFFLSVLRYTNLLTVLPSSTLLPFWRFLAPSTRENKRERAIDGLAQQLMLVRYLSYKGPVTYMAAVFDSHFETLPRKGLLRMADAHGLSARSAHLTLDDLRDTLSDHIFGGGCAAWLSHSIANIPVGCLDCLQEFVFSDKVRSRNRWSSSSSSSLHGTSSGSDLAVVVVNNTNGTRRSFGASLYIFARVFK